MALDVVFDYDKWIKNSFFGIGSISQNSAREYYTKESVELGVAMSRGITPNTVGQFGIRYKAIRNYDFSAGSRLIGLAPALNAATARYASLFFSLRYDTRNSFVNPSGRWVLQGETELVPRSGLCNVAFTRLGT
jgi:outer membrane protein assembly factor BamA